MGKYIWNFNGDAETWNNDTYETIEECIADAQATAKENGEDYHDVVYIGECNPFVPCVDAEMVLDNLEERAYEFAGEVGLDWEAFNCNKRDEIDELSNALSAIVIEWLKKHGYYPEFYAVENIKPYPLKQEAAQ